MNEDYPLFLKWTKTLDWILDRSEAIPKKARFSIASRIANHAMDVMEYIIEAIYTKNRAHLLNHMNMNIEKLRVLFRICHTRRYISVTQYEYISRELNEAGRMIGGWRKITE